VSLVNGEYVPDTDSVKRRYVEAVFANKLATREEAETEFDRWFSTETEVAEERGFNQARQQ
jgi:hypothetical protein